MHDRLQLSFNNWLFVSVEQIILTRPCPSAIVDIPIIMKPDDILALLSVKPEDIPEISANIIKSTRTSIKADRVLVSYEEQEF